MYKLTKTERKLAKKSPKHLQAAKDYKQQIINNGYVKIEALISSYLDRGCTP
tara:strand:- start:186 stop:341 length:156 start_codon:yes stop_codon:yes gene_type:complete